MQYAYVSKNLLFYLNEYSNSYKIGYVLRRDLARSVKYEWEQVRPRLQNEMARGETTTEHTIRLAIDDLFVKNNTDNSWTKMNIESVFFIVFSVLWVVLT
jgi:hypothetical protein